MNIKLYQYENCPFCHRVRDKLKELGLEYEAVDVSSDGGDGTRKMLVEKSGVMTVPVLEVDGEFIGESNKIIEKLESLKK